MSEAAGLALLSLSAIIFLGAFTRMSWLGMATLGGILGVSVYTLIGTLLVVTAGWMVPQVGLLVTSLMLGAIGIGRRRRPDRRTMAAIVLCLIGIAATAALTLSTAPIRLTPDSLQYIAIADMITERGGFDAVPGPMIVKRGLSAPLVQTLGALDDRPYSAVASPFIVFSAFAALGVIIHRALANGDSPRNRITLVALLAVLFAASSNRALYDAFYVNSHGLLAATFLVVVAGGFLGPKRGGWLLAVAIAAAAMIPARPEGILLAAIGLLPVVTHPSLRRLERVLLTAPSVVTSIVWFGLGLWSRAPGDRTASLSDPVTGGLAIGIGLGVVAVIAGHPILGRWASVIPWIPLAGMVALLGLEYRRDPDPLIESFGATAQNLSGAGLWGITWLVLGVLVAAAMFGDGFEDDRLFILPLASFGVLFWLLPYLRDGGYRVGAGDSGNRVLAHALLAAIAYVAIAAAKGDPVSDRPVSDRPEHHEATP